MSTYWTSLKKEEIWQEYTYKHLGKITTEKEAVARCLICGAEDQDLVGKNTSGGYTGMICIDCFKACAKEFETICEDRVNEKLSKELLDFFKTSSREDFQKRIRFIQKTLQYYYQELRTK